MPKEVDCLPVSASTQVRDRSFQVPSNGLWPGPIEDHLDDEVGYRRTPWQDSFMKWFPAASLSTMLMDVGCQRVLDRFLQRHRPPLGPGQCKRSIAKSFAGRCPEPFAVSKCRT